MTTRLKATGLACGCLVLLACAGTRDIAEPARDATAPARAADQVAPEVVGTVALDARAPGEDELVCRREQITGSHMRVRRCYTRDQLASMREAAQQMLRDVRDLSVGVESPEAE